MTHNSTPLVTKEAAAAFIHKLSRPVGMTRPTWRGVRLLLEAIIVSYPKATPSQVRLAARMDVPVRSVQRYMAAAVAHGLLVVEADAGAKPRRKWGSRTNRYWVSASASYDARMARDENHSYSVGVPGASPQETSSPGTQRESASLDRTPPGSTVVQMREWTEPERQVGRKALPARSKTPPRRRTAGEIVTPIDSRRRKTPRALATPPRWRNLTEYFLATWEQAQLESPRLKGIRPLESLGHARSYINAHFAKTPELEVRRMMTEFVTGVSNGSINIKSGQSAWMCFTGAWGRQQYVEPDDYYAEEFRKLAEGKPK